MPFGGNYTNDQLAEIEQNCSPPLPDLIPSYSYFPGLGVGIAFDVLFGLALLGHIFQLVRFRRWTSGLLATGALIEVVGWAGRTWSAKCPYTTAPFLMQIVTLIIAPVFFSAALYVLLGMMIRLMGPTSSVLSPKWYAIIFCACDVISLVVQAVGGAMASAAANTPGGDTDKGTHVMVGGIVFQLFTMTLFAGFGLDFWRRTRGADCSRNIKLVLLAMVVSFVMIYIRSIYRTIELAQGWFGHLITHEGYFIGLDAAVMVVAVGVFNFIDPAVLLPRTSGVTRDAAPDRYESEQRREKSVVNSSSE